MTRPNDGSLIGQSIPRPKARQFTSGRGRYTDDVRVPGLLHAAFLRSPHAHARIVSIALDQARLLPGVSAVYTAEENRFWPVPLDGIMHLVLKAETGSASTTTVVRQLVCCCTPTCGTCCQGCLCCACCACCTSETAHEKTEAELTTIVVDADESGCCCGTRCRVPRKLKDVVGWRLYLCVFWRGGGLLLFLFL